MTNIFRTAVFRLTAWYLALLMLLSAVFSVALYRVSSSEVETTLRAQELTIRRYYPNPGGGFDFQTARDEQLEESRTHIAWNLVFFNVWILLLGGAASYFLARRTLEPIQQAHEAQERFASDASHELRTPLTSIKTELEVALRDSKLSLTDSKELHRSTLEEVGRMEVLAHSLLQLAHRDKKETQNLFKDVPLATLAEEALKNVQIHADKHGIKLELNIGKQSVKGDELSLVELFTILLDNAVKYSNEGGTVKLESASEHGRVVVRVRDEGMGIRSSDIPHIFDRFYRADTSRTKNAPGGYGLGLSIAKKIADLHGATISVKSVPGEGSTFAVSFPAAGTKTPKMHWTDYLG